MSAITFDTHRFIKKLEKKGFTETQAEGVVELVKEVREEAKEELATKNDLKHALELSESRIVNKVGGMLIALGIFTISAFVGCLAFFLQHIKP
ncbi:MAG: coiled-coil domain-containing protein [Pseudomonadota bacterium]